jgi:hypothetical protein
MRKVLALAILALALPALAANSTEQAIKGTGTYGTAGCGLGSLAFGNQRGGVQIFAATTNSLFGTQTFGMTSGTSNCGPSVFAMGTKNFVEANREAVAKDISRGQGESIGALTVINGCQDSHGVGAALQRNFGAIFPSEQASSDEITKAILETLHSDPALGCKS